ncbi:hypothetical protein ACS0TY_021750 [Phlomoides rotata]
MAAVHRGLGHRLPCHQVTNFLNLPALGMRQPPYMSPGPGHCDPLCEEAPLLQKLRGYFVEFLRESCLAPLGALLFKGRSSFSWEYDVGYFSTVAPGARTLARGIFYTPSYPEKAGTPYVLESITIFQLT